MTSIPLNFSSNYYKETALNKKTASYETDKTAKDAFLLCIQDVPYEDLDNLCTLIQKYYKFSSKPINLTTEEAYALTQGYHTKEILCDDSFKRTLITLAYQCIATGKTLGSKKRANGNDSTSSWISHCLHEGQAAATLAKQLGLDPDTAKKLGILHDIGRKYTHNFLHTIAGFELLVDEGWEEEAIICLTHSFLGDKNEKEQFLGNRCGCCDPATEGFFIDEKGNPAWQSYTRKDDITLFLENYTYNYYDLLINIADLMATSSNITSPYDRVDDIATRTPIDPTNRNYFKVTFTNLMLHILQKVGKIDQPIDKLKAKPTTPDEQIDEIFCDTSALFTNYYNDISPQKIALQDKPTKK